MIFFWKLNRKYWWTRNLIISIQNIEPYLVFNNVGFRMENAGLVIIFFDFCWFITWHFTLSTTNFQFIFTIFYRFIYLLQIKNNWFWLWQILLTNHLMC
jgi:hypothetical protein